MSKSKRRELRAHEALELALFFDRAANSGKVSRLRSAVDKAIRADNVTRTDLVSAIATKAGVRCSEIRTFSEAPAAGMNGRVRDALRDMSEELRVAFHLNDHDSRLPSQLGRYAPLEAAPTLPGLQRMAAGHPRR